MDIINAFIFFAIFFLTLLILHSIFMGNIREGLSKKDNQQIIPPDGEPYPEGDDPPPNPPEFEKTEPNIPPKGEDKNPVPSYCGCLNSKSRTLYNKHTDILSDIKKEILKLVGDVEKIKPRVQKISSTVSKTRDTDLKLCCEGVNNPSATCWKKNEYKCSS